ncbi:hypothetical protein BDU57DRAFT_32365 [Ampelomyces quisqualis]|uniref:Uncharacterized protein n=1 Tax=Ampelomyces quisqualis TaxID=50730 RepID=A0A6A5R1K2_AMPQU|nr:hypothetical protein BDU57DRAFT_32365 [Ampelomyces quisqualis]
MCVLLSEAYIKTTSLVADRYQIRTFINVSLPVMYIMIFMVIGVPAFTSLLIERNVAQLLSHKMQSL